MVCARFSSSLYLGFPFSFIVWKESLSHSLHWFTFFFPSRWEQGLWCPRFGRPSPLSSMNPYSKPLWKNLVSFSHSPPLPLLLILFQFLSFFWCNLSLLLSLLHGADFNGYVKQKCANSNEHTLSHPPNLIRTESALSLSLSLSLSPFLPLSLSPYFSLPPSLPTSCISISI